MGYVQNVVTVLMPRDWLHGYSNAIDERMVTGYIHAQCTHDITAFIVIDINHLCTPFISGRPAGSHRLGGPISK